MTVRDIAKTFRINVNQLSSISGYSRQGLYDLINGKTRANKRRFTAFLDHLQFISDSQHEKDIVQARIEKNEREKMLKEIRNLIKEDTPNANPTD